MFSAKEFKSRNPHSYNASVFENNYRTSVGNGFTYLHMAVSQNMVEEVKSALENGFDPNVKDWGLNTPLHIAVTYNCWMCVALLLNNSTTKIDIQNKAGHTAKFLINDLWQGKNAERLSAFFAIRQQGKLIDLRDLENEKNINDKGSLKNTNDNSVSIDNDAIAVPQTPHWGKNRQRSLELEDNISQEVLCITNNENISDINLTGSHTTKTEINKPLAEGQKIQEAHPLATVSNETVEDTILPAAEPLRPPEENSKVKLHTHKDEIVQNYEHSRKKEIFTWQSADSKQLIDQLKTSLKFEDTYQSVKQYLFYESRGFFGRKKTHEHTRLYGVIKTVLRNHAIALTPLITLRNNY